MVLVNGSEGIGTGWSTFVPNYNPRDIIENVQRLLNDSPWNRWIHGIGALRCVKQINSTSLILKHNLNLCLVDTNVKKLPGRYLKISN